MRSAFQLARPRLAPASSVYSHLGSRHVSSSAARRDWAHTAGRAARPRPRGRGGLMALPRGVAIFAALAASAAGGALGARLGPLPPQAPPAEVLAPELVRSVLGFLRGRPRLAWCAGDGAVVLVGARGGQLLSHVDAVRALHFSADGSRLVRVGCDGSAVVADARSGRTLHVLERERGWSFDVRVARGDDRIMSLGSDARVVIWSAATGEELLRIELRGAEGHQLLRVFPGGDRVVTADSILPDHPPVIWNLASGAVLHRLGLPRGGSVRLLELSPCGARLVTVGESGVHLWRAADGWLLHELASSSDATEVVISIEGRTVAANSPGAVHIWCGLTGIDRARIVTSAGPGLTFPRIALVGDGRGDRLAAVTPVSAAIWDIASLEQLVELAPLRGVPVNVVDRVAVSPDGASIAACGYGWELPPRAGPSMNWAAMWNVSTGLVLRRSRGERGGALHTSCSVGVGLAITTMAEELLD